MLSIITAYNLTDIIIRACKRSDTTSTNAAIIRSVFENLSVKDLSILIIINIYNHYMSEINIANWYWADFTILWLKSYYYWKFLFY